MQSLHIFTPDLPQQFQNLSFWESFPPQIQKLFIYETARYLEFEEQEITDIQESLELFNAFLESAFEKTKRFNIYGARAIMEDLRWHTKEHDNSPKYKINNDITPSISKLSMQMFPSLNGFFKTRN